MLRRAFLVLLAASAFAPPASAQEDPPLLRVIDVEMYPTRRAQIAVWLERGDGTFVRTLGLTRAVAYRGIGNRPGASQMNSGFRWPYGRREGVLPVWAHRRARAPGAIQFRRVIFQDRSSEGWASRSSNDFSRDDYFCLSFNQDASSMDALDAVTCPSVFNSDKGRYLDEDESYAEPFEDRPGMGVMRMLDPISLYPPRRDALRCTGSGCYDHEDVESYVADARAAMPEIDSVTMATPPEGRAHSLMFSVPPDWENGEYVVWVEVNTEGDYNTAWGVEEFPTPINPEGEWDFWAMGYGYPYRGQPSVVYRVPFTLSFGATIETALEPEGYGSIGGTDGELQAMDGTITNDPMGSPGSGVDRLLQGDRGHRVQVRVIGPEVCMENVPPAGIPEILVTEFPERSQAHRYAHLRFVATSDDFGIARYEVRVSEDPIVDEESFMRALQASAATLEGEALVVPTPPAGDAIEVDFGGLSPERHYYIAVRAVDLCNVGGEMAVAEFNTPAIEFTTVSPCFVATAAYGTPMAEEIDVLRRFRERHLRTNAFGRGFIAAYETVGPVLAGVIRPHEDLRAMVRSFLRPIVDLARAAEE